MEVESIISNQDFDESVDICNVFVKYLPCNFTEGDLYDLFEQYGEIVNTKVMVNIKTGNSLGYGFVRFSNPEDAQEAIKNMNRFQVGYKTLLCKLSKPSNSPPVSPYSSSAQEPSSPTTEQQRDPSNTLYVRVLSPTITDAILKSTFSQYGDVVEAQVLIDTNSGKSKRAGVIKFSSIQHSMNALQYMTGSLILGETPLVVKYAPNRKQIPHLSLAGSSSILSTPNPQSNSNVLSSMTASPSTSSISSNISSSSSSSSSSVQQQQPPRSPSPQPVSLPTPPTQRSSSPQPLPIQPQRSSSPQPQALPPVPQYTYVYQNEPYTGYYTQDYNAGTYSNGYYPQVYSSEPIIISSSPNSSPPIYHQVHHASPAPSNWNQNENSYYVYHHPQSTPYYYHHPQQPAIVYSLPQQQQQTIHHSPSTSPQHSPRENRKNNTNISNNLNPILICTYKGTLENSNLINIFSKYGDLKSINININPTSGKSKCFISFNALDSALIAQQSLDNTRIGSQFIRVKFLTVN